MNGIILSAIVCSGSAIGAKIALPHEYSAAIAVFAVVNGVFAALVFYVGRSLVRMYRDPPRLF